MNIFEIYNKLTSITNEIIINGYYSYAKPKDLLLINTTKGSFTGNAIIIFPFYTYVISLYNSRIYDIANKDIISID